MHTDEDSVQAEVCLHTIYTSETIHAIKVC